MSAEVPWLATRPSLIAAGHTDGELRRLRLAGELATIRRGAYVVVRAGHERLPAADRHALAIRATLSGLDRPAVVSHASAAVLHRVPLWRLSLGRVHLTRPGRSGGRLGGDVHLHTAPLRPDEVVEVDGIAVTSLARTVTDIARCVPFEPAVVIADAALSSGLDPAGLLTGAMRAARWPGAPRARRVVAFADGRTESVGESRSRVAIHLAGLAAPTPQWEVRRGAELVGRCDFGWPEERVVGEFDGRVKYGRLLRPGQEPGDVVFEEKVREDALRAEGWHVLRWTWRDLAAFDAIARRLRGALGVRVGAARGT